MRHPSDRPMPRFELRWLRSVANLHYQFDHGGALTCERRAMVFGSNTWATNTEQIG